MNSYQHDVFPLRLRLQQKSVCSLDHYINDIKFEIESLLNSRSCAWLWSNSLSSLDQSLLHYGLPNSLRWGRVSDFMSGYLIKTITDLIQLNEPRLSQIEVFVDDYGYHQNDFTLYLCIQGSVTFASQTTTLLLRSQCNPLNMRFSLL